MSPSDQSAGFRSGYVAIVGKPNVGKSTLLNALVDFKVAIVSSKPQTTRNRIVAIRTDERSQMVFVDTPGIHRPTKELNEVLLTVVKRAIADVDVILYLVDSQSTEIDVAEQFTLEILKNAKAPKILVPNKIDLIKKVALLPLIERFKSVVEFQDAVPISALKGDGVNALFPCIEALLPIGPQYYPKDQLTDVSERDIAAEIIREKIFLHTEQEIPYSAAVIVEQFEEMPKKHLVHIHATIHVEKSSQKGIVIGKGGKMLRTIGEAARLELERLLGTRIFLELFVRVEKNWTRDPKALRRLGLLEKE